MRLAIIRKADFMARSLKRLAGPALGFFLAIPLLLVTAAPVAGQDGGMCNGQPPITENDLVSAVKVLKELMVKSYPIAFHDKF